MQRTASTPNPVTTLRDFKVSHDVMVPYLSGDNVSYHQETVKTSAYRCDACGSVWAKRWYAETCADRKHRAQFDQVYTHRAEGFQTTGKYVEVAYTRYRLGRDTRIPALT